MDFESVRIAARRDIQGITTIHPTLALSRVSLSEEARSTSLASLVETLNISASLNHTPEVGS